IELWDCGKVIRADGGCLGGSALSMDRAVAGFMALSGAGLADALRAASENPARLLGGRSLCRAVAPGQPANLFSFHQEAGSITVKATFIAGTQTY
ncbi:MAG: hypothetical protein ABFE07_10170, partial [Armatimonadia bacterium]